MANLCIIPARGGSKRIPRKNIKDFLGKPIIAYSIEVALQSGLFEEVMVSTDDHEISTVAQRYGAKVPFLRSLENAGDFAKTMDVLKEVVEAYNRHFNKSFDFICCIYPTAPFIKQEQLSTGWNLLTKEDLDSVFPVVPFSHPVWRGFEVVNDKTKLVWPNNLNIRSQDLNPIYHDAGQWYWYNPTRINDIMFTDNTSSIILSEDEVQDIDTLTDWKLAEMKYKLQNER